MGFVRYKVPITETSYLREKTRGWLSVGDRTVLVGYCKDFRKPMLYPVSYEGLPCLLPSTLGECWSVGLGLAASFQTVCAGSVPRAVDQRHTASTRRAECTVGGRVRRRSRA